MPIRITGLNSGLDTDSIVKELVSAYRLKQENYTKAQTKLSWKQDAWKELNTKIYSFYSKTLSNMRWVGNYNKKKTTVSDSTKAKVTADSSVVNGTQRLRVNNLATGGHLTGKELKLVNGEDGAKITNSTKLSDLGIETESGKLMLEVGGEPKEITVNKDMTVSEFVSALKKQGVNASFDANNQRFFMDSTASGLKNDFNFVTEDANSFEILDKLGLATKDNYMQAYNVSEDEVPKNNTFAAKQNAEDAEIELNGMIFTSDSNTFKINGLTITATGKNADGEYMSISTETDVDGIYDMIKDFFKEYNSLMNSMETLYNAKSAKDYEPLTDDEKSEMSDEEIEKWEAKIKDSLLRRDDTLGSVLSAMSSAMSKTVEVNGKKLSLSSFGINTSGYFLKAENESYAFHINGDKDDASVESYADKLRAAIEEDPDAVASFFSDLAKGLYSTLDEKMKHTELSSSYTIYNDVQLQKEYDNYTELIKKWEDKLADLEDYYYKKFSAMETALAKLQSQTDSLTSLLGG